MFGGNWITLDGTVAQFYIDGIGDREKTAMQPRLPSIVCGVDGDGVCGGGGGQRCRRNSDVTQQRSVTARPVTENSTSRSIPYAFSERMPGDRPSIDALTNGLYAIQWQLWT